MNAMNLTTRMGRAILVAAAVLLCFCTVALGQEQSTPTTLPTSAPADNGELNEGVNESQPGTFEIHVQEADLRGVLQLLSTQGKKNIIATKEVTGSVTADLYSVTFKEALEAVLKATGFVYIEKGNFIYVYTQEQKDKIVKAEQKTITKTFRLYYITAADTRTLVSPALSSEGSISVTPAAAMGIKTSTEDTGGNTYATEDVLVVKDYEENIRKITQIISELDVRPDQVLIEATLLRATLNEDNALGIDFQTLAGVNWNAFGSTTPGVQDLTTGTANVGDLDLAAATFRTDFNTGIPAGGMTIGFIANDTAFFVRALETVTDVTVMANPKLLVVNKQRGEVMVGNRSGYITTTVTETVATQTVEFLETGTRLVVRPYIGKNGYVRMEIHPEDSSGSVTDGLPNETTTEVTSNVMVKDGHTIVIGGLFRERTEDGRAQVPLAGNIPYLGTLFRRTVDETDREEVVIMITPRIIQNEADEAISEQLKDDAERFRVGQRKGLRWWGRDRLAQQHLRWARKELAAGDREKALWNIDMALSLQPRMEEAIRMKERLTEKAYWADESQYSAAKYIMQRMAVQGSLDKPVERAIPWRKPRDGEKLEADVRDALGVKHRPEDPILPNNAPVRPEADRPKE